MLIIPAIDLSKGRVVRLFKGAFDSETVYSDSPIKVMERWQGEGAQMVHVVDLDGAREGISQNLETLEEILAVAKTPVQFGGGLRTFEAVSEVLSLGVKRAVIGTKAFDRKLMTELVRRFEEQIVVGLDIREGVIQIRGWQSADTSYAPEDFCRELEQLGVKTIVCTDVVRDGTMQGPNVELLKQLLRATKMNVIASGGISNVDDLKQLSKIKSKNFEGVIVGKALYEGKINLKDAIEELGASRT